jgi:CO/xanthine dehydrogenase FAD-binding subunit
VLEADAEVAGPNGTRTLPLREFFRGPGVNSLESGELLTAVEVPDPRPGAVGAFLKKGRVRMDLSLVSVAVLLETDDRLCTRVRIAAGSVAPVPMRLREVEELLEGEELTDELLMQAGTLASRTVMPIDDVRSTAEYRRHLTGVYVRRAIEQAMQEGAA